MFICTDRKQYYLIIILLMYLFGYTIFYNVKATNMYGNNYVPIYLSENISINLNFNISKHQSATVSATTTLLQSNNVSHIVGNSNIGHNYSSSSNTKENNSPYPVPSQTDATYIVQELAHNLETKLKTMRNIELGIPFIQEIFDAMEFTTITRNDTKLVAQMSERLTMKLNRAARVINDTRKYLRKNVLDMWNTKRSSIYLHSIVHPCPYEDQKLDQHYDKSQIEILNYLKNFGSHHDDLNYTINSKIVDAIKQVNYSVPNLNQLYFLSKDDFASDNNCHAQTDYSRLRNLFTSSIKNKQILLLVDHGSSLNADQLDLTKTFANQIIHLLNEHDRISIVAISGKSISYENIDELSNPIKPNKWHACTMDNKLLMLKFIDNLNRTKDITNHTLGFQYSFDLLKNIETIPRGNVPVFMLYISRGLLSPLTEAKSVLEAIASGQQQLKMPVIINTCAIVLDEKRVMYEKQFLKDVAMQNYTKYNIDVTEWYQSAKYNLTGTMFVVNKRYPDEMAKTSAAVLGHWFQKRFIQHKLIAHKPVIDAVAKDVIISLTQSFEELGVVGVDMFLSDIAEDVIYYNKYKDSYAFIIDLNGYAIMHPSYPRPLTMRTDPFSTHIFYLEQYKGFNNVCEKMLSAMHGNETITINEEHINRTITYTWHRVSNFYVISIVTVHSSKSKQPVHLSHVSPGIHHYEHNDINSNAMSELLYHRIDLIPPRSPLCKHFKQMATMEGGTLFLSASSFKSPFVYLKNNRKVNEDARIHNAKSIMAYIKDTTNLLANPGLMPQIRNDVTALFHIMTYLKKRHLEGGVFRKYIIRRYVATVNGVMQVYPGCMLDANLEAIRRPWFIKAMEHPGKIVMTEPYLDAGGAGYIVTISHTIFEGKSNALHNAERDVPVAIVSIDLTLGVIYKLLLQSATFCSEINVKCFLMEDKGYLVAHQSILEPITINRKNNRRPVEHITHKESYVANDILYHKLLVQKKLCTNYFNRTNQRYYQFNTSLTDVMTNIVHGERTKYQITLVPGTNVFIGLLNSTCDGGAFCPCSTVDRTCLNCNRMEQTYCECPCECPLVMPMQPVNYETNSSDCNSTSNCYSYGMTDICRPLPEQLPSINSMMYDVDVDLKACVNINCELYTTHTDCLGIMGCEWCQVDVDGETLFTSPFCTQQSSCFNGVLGSVTPYGDGDLGAAIVDSIVPPAYSAIGPVSGAIIALCLVVGFAMYCYRQNLDSVAEQLYAESIPENNFGLPLARLDFDDITPHDDGDLGSNNMNRNLLRPMHNAVAVPDISPYRMNAGSYRRPNGESDHGYSTMTPHEDSEHLCFALAEPLINNRRLSMSDSVSINTSVSSPANYNHCVSMEKTIPGMTMLLPSSPHHIQAPVTVHHPMEIL